MHIKFKIRRTSDKSGKTLNARVSHIESDMPGKETWELPYILHALTLVDKIQISKYFTLNASSLNGDDYLA
jgi:hypothetical protein